MLQRLTNGLQRLTIGTLWPELLNYSRCGRVCPGKTLSGRNPQLTLCRANGLQQGTLSSRNPQLTLCRPNGL
jgi:hypothetical protein